MTWLSAPRAWRFVSSGGGCYHLIYSIVRPPPACLFNNLNMLQSFPMSVDLANMQDKITAQNPNKTAFISRHGSKWGDPPGGELLERSRDFIGGLVYTR